LALTPGTCLGPYEIAAQIGVGGMGATGTRVVISAVEERDKVLTATTIDVGVAVAATK